MSITFDEYLEKNSYATFTHCELKKHDAKVRADAIDEFKDLLLKHKSKDEYPVMCFDEFTLNRLAEQLKEK